MIFKTLMLLGVIATVYFVGRSHARRGEEPPPARGVSPPPSPRRGTPFQLAVYSAVVAVAGLAAWYIYDDWAESKILVRIRVINAETGQVALYDAPKGLVYGRAFTTADGRRVTLADVERMEVQPMDKHGTLP